KPGGHRRPLRTKISDLVFAVTSFGLVRRTLQLDLKFAAHTKPESLGTPVRKLDNVFLKVLHGQGPRQYPLDLPATSIRIANSYNVSYVECHGNPPMLGITGVKCVFVNGFLWLAGL